MSLRKALFSVVTFGIVFGIVFSFVFGSATAFAEDGAVAAQATGRGLYDTLGAALAIGLAAFGGALGQGRTATAALEGIARNPAASGKVFVPMIIGLALIESLVLYAFVIAFVKILP
jgi:F-type H+-transporting ATPase subunit c